MLELLHYPKSTCSQKVRLVLHEKGLDFVDTVVDLSRGEHLTPEYLALNPKGVVPTLRHDGAVITDSSVIMEYLDEVFPDPPLSGRTALDRARVREWLRYFEEVPTVAIRIPSFAQVLLAPLSRLTPDQRRAQSDRRPLRRDLYRSMENGISDERQAQAMERLRLTLTQMEKRLCTHDWLAGAGFSLADACIIPVIDRMQDLGHAGQWSDLPGVGAWWARVQTRPAHARTYAGATRLIGAGSPPLTDTVA